MDLTKLSSFGNFEKRTLTAIERLAEKQKARKKFINLPDFAKNLKSSTIKTFEDADKPIRITKS